MLNAQKRGRLAGSFGNTNQCGFELYNDFGFMQDLINEGKSGLFL